MRSNCLENIVTRSKRGIPISSEEALASIMFTVTLLFFRTTGHFDSFRNLSSIVRLRFINNELTKHFLLLFLLLLLLLMRNQSPACTCVVLSRHLHSSTKVRAKIQCLTVLAHLAGNFVSVIYQFHDLYT